MARNSLISALVASLFLVVSANAHGELLAMVNYESKPDQQPRKEGIAIVDIDPASTNYGKIMTDIPAPPDAVLHHIFYNRDKSKAFITALGENVLWIMDMAERPYRLGKVAVPGCSVGEDVAHSTRLNRWYLTCMGSANVIVGDAATNEVIATIDLPVPWPHGVSVLDDIDRILVSSTVNPGNLKEAGEHIVEIQASTNKVLEIHRMSSKPSPSGAAPVEIFHVPGSNPPAAYITNMFEGSLWIATWESQSRRFTHRQVDDFTKLGQGVPLEVYFNGAGDRAYISTANPGHLNVYDISTPGKPKLMSTVAAAGGAHHMVFSPDGRYAFVQNSLLNLPGMSDGSISVIDLNEAKRVDSIDTFKAAGLNPNSIVLMPQYATVSGH